MRTAAQELEEIHTDTISALIASHHEDLQTIGNLILLNLNSSVQQHDLFAN